MNIRRKVFFMLDHDHMIDEQLKEIVQANEDDDFAKKFHDKCIGNLLEQIKLYVPFYQNLSCENFADLPVVNKVMMRENMDSFRSVAPLKLGKIRHTSGSTGIPFEILQDVRKAKRIQAEVIYYREITGDVLGTKYINLISPSRIDKASKLSDFKQNVVAFDVTKMDSTTLEKLHSVLLRNRDIYYMMGFASALERIADYFLEKGYQNQKFPLKAIVSSSEILTPTTFEKLRSVFKCPIFDRYSNEDNGFIAQTDGISRDFLVNRGSYFVEILKMDRDVPAEENEIGRIVITDYFNYLQPFVRYDTGDLGAYSYRKIGATRFVITKLAGRISDVVYNENDEPISTFAIGCIFEVFSKIKQYQLIQNTKNEFVLNIINPQRDYSDDEFVKALKTVLGNSIHVHITYVNNIPVLNSGKFKRVICNYVPQKNNKK